MYSKFSSSYLILLLMILSRCQSLINHNVTGLHVHGKKILNGNGEAVKLYGVNRSGMEYACIPSGGTLSDGVNDLALVLAFKTWNINIVRLPVNEDCWLNINGVGFGGAEYQSGLNTFVDLLTENGLAVIIDLHWAAPGTQVANEQLAMPDRDHTPTFWTQVATIYGNYSNVLFDLFNEPFPCFYGSGMSCAVYNCDNTATPAWECWLNGGSSCPGNSYVAAGMQELVDAVRATNATNILMAGGIGYGGCINMWDQYKPKDPTGNLIASIHIYDSLGCRDDTCFTQLTQNLTSAPYIIGEMGEIDCHYDFVDGLMTWADGQAPNAGYLGWSWNPYGTCADILVSDASGTPTGYGIGVKCHFAELSGTPCVNFTYESMDELYGTAGTLLVYYDESLGSAFSDWSWSVRNFTSTVQVHSGSSSISDVVDSSTALRFVCNHCIDPRYHAGIQFWINGGTMGNQSINIQLWEDGQNSPPVSVNIATILTGSTEILAGTWLRGYLDLSKVPQQTYDGIIFQPNAGTVSNTVYFDDIYVLAVLTAAQAAVPTGPQVMTIYDNVVGPSFKQDGWESGAVMNSTTFSHSPPFSIFDPLDAWSAIRFDCLNNDCIDPSIHSGISFWINGGSGSGQKIEVSVLNTNYTSVGPTHFVADILIGGTFISAGTWLQGFIDLSLYPPGIKGGIWFQEFTGSPQPPVYFDDLYVLGIPSNSGSTTTTGFTTGSTSLGAPLITVYDNSINPAAFQDGSWETGRIMDYSLLYHSPPNSIFDPLDSWTAIRFDCLNFGSCLDPTIHSGISFWVNGGNSSGQAVNVNLLNTTGNPIQPNPSVASLLLGGATEIQADTWIQGFIDFSLFPSGLKQGFWFQAFEGTKQPPIYFDDIYVLGFPAGTTSTGAASSSTTTGGSIPNLALVVYDNALGSSFQDWSYGETGKNLASTANFHSPPCSILDPMFSWGALRFECSNGGCIDPAIHGGISFWIYGGSSGGQILSFSLLNDTSGTPAGPTPYLADHLLNGLTSIPANTWVEGFIDLSVYPAGPKCGFWFQSASGDNQPTVYLDDIYVLFPVVTSTSTSTSVSVSTSTSTSTASPMTSSDSTSSISTSTSTSSSTTGSSSSQAIVSPKSSNLSHQNLLIIEIVVPIGGAILIALFIGLVVYFVKNASNSYSFKKKDSSFGMEKLRMTVKVDSAEV